MNDNLVENIMAEMAESGLYKAEEEGSVRGILSNAYENEERELHDALFSILMRKSTKEGLAHIVVFHMWERAKEYG